MDWDILSKFGMPVALELPKFQAWPKQKPEVDLRRCGRHLVKSIWRHNSIGDHPICIKFGRPVQNHMPMAVKRSKSKSEVEFQDGGRLFSETGSSNISAVDWDTRSKFDTQIFFCFLVLWHLAFLKARCHKTRKQKNIYNGMAAIWKNLHNVITLSVIVQFRPNLFRPCRIIWRWR